MAKDRRGARRGGTVVADGSEFLHLVLDYLKQETLGPLRALGRYLAFGTAGALAIAIGLVLMALALLRVLQTETGSTFTGHLSWLPYVITAGASILVIAASVWRIVAGGGPTRLASEKK